MPITLSIRKQINGHINNHSKGQNQLEQAVKAITVEVEDGLFSLRTARRLFLAAVFLVPLAVNPWGVQPYTLIKINIWRLLTAVALIIWSAAALSRGRLKLRLSRLHPFFLVFLAVTALATLFAVDKTVAFFGYFMRYEGLWAFIAYGFIFTLCCQLFDRLETVREYLVVLMSASVIICLAALLEFFGYSLLPELINDPGRLASLWGNPGYLGGFLTLTLPLALALLLEGEGFSNIKVLALINLSLGLPVLFFSHTKSAWLGTALAGLLLLLLIEGRARRRLAPVAAALVLIIVLTAPVIVTGNQAAARRVSGAAKLNLNQAGRLFYWRTAAKSLKYRPLLGYGPDTFYFAYRLHRSADWRRFDTEGRPVDKAHNDLLQTAVNAGLVGLAAYLALIAALFTILARRLSRGQNDDRRYLIVGLTASLAAYLVFTQAYFSTVELTPYFWSLAAAALALSDRTGEGWSFSLDKPAVKGVIIILTAAMVFFINFTVRTQIADYYFRRGFIAAQSQDWPQIIAANSAAAAWDPTEMTYRRYLGIAQLKKAAESRRDDDFAAAASTYHRLISRHPKWADAYVGLGDTLAAAARLTGKSTLPAALRAYRQADRLVKFSPTVKADIDRTKKYMKAKR